MSYDIYLKDPHTGEILRADEPHFVRGGTYAAHGTQELHLNITYNYAKIFARALNDERGIRSIYGLSGARSMPVLIKAINSLDDDVHDDYWAATEGNAKAALKDLVVLAKMRPEGIWDGD